MHALRAEEERDKRSAAEREDPKRNTVFEQRNH